MKYLLIGVGLLLISLPTSWILGTNFSKDQAKFTYTNTLPSLWTIPVRGVHYTYRAEGKILAKDPEWVLQTDQGKSLTFARAKNLEVTLGKAITAEDARKWLLVTPDEIQVGDRLIITYYHDQVNSRNIPVTIFLYK